MALALLFIGVLFVVAAVRNQQSALLAQLEGDFSGSSNFLFWAAAIVLLGAIGYIPKLKPISVALLVLVLVSIALKKGTGFFAQLTQTLNASVTSGKTNASGNW